MERHQMSHNSVRGARTYYMPIGVGGMLTTALIDTGCSTEAVISLQMFGKFPIAIRRQLKPSQTHGIAVNGTRVFTKGTLTIPLKFGSGILTTANALVTSISDSVILGFDLIVREGWRLKFDLHMCEIHGKDIPCWPTSFEAFRAGADMGFLGENRTIKIDRSQMSLRSANKPAVDGPAPYPNRQPVGQPPIASTRRNLLVTTPPASITPPAPTPNGAYASDKAYVPFAEIQRLETVVLKLEKSLYQFSSVTQRVGPQPPSSTPVVLAPVADVSIIIDQRLCTTWVQVSRVRQLSLRVGRLERSLRMLSHAIRLCVPASHAHMQPLKSAETASAQPVLQPVAAANALPSQIELKQRILQLVKPIRVLASVIPMVSSTLPQATVAAASSKVILQKL